MFTNNTAIPTTIDLRRELESIVDWYSLGIGLKLKDHQLKCIEKNHQHDVERCKIEMLNYWQENTTTADCTWEAVATAVGLMGTHDRVADTIRKKYITSTSTTSNRGTVLLHM